MSHRNSWHWRSLDCGGAKPSILDNFPEPPERGTIRGKFDSRKKLCYDDEQTTETERNKEPAKGRWTRSGERWKEPTTTNGKKYVEGYGRRKTRTHHAAVRCCQKSFGKGYSIRAGRGLYFHNPGWKTTTMNGGHEEQTIYPRLLIRRMDDGPCENEVQNVCSIICMTGSNGCGEGARMCIAV